MDYGLYLSAAGMKSQLVRQDVIANNLANSQTNGFKRDLTMMRSRANPVFEDSGLAGLREPVLENQGGGVFINNGGIDLSQGLLEKTGNTTDLALDGKGFFTVQGENGQKLLTRDGQFLMASDGTLVTANGGRKVLDASGQPITLDTELPVQIGSDGAISQGGPSAAGGTGGGAAGVQLGIVDVSDPRKLMKLGANVLSVTSPDALAAAPAGTRVRQGSLESSGTDPFSEMVNMMEGIRAFEANTKMISYQDTTLQEINTIGKIA